MVAIGRVKWMVYQGGNIRPYWELARLLTEALGEPIHPYDVRDWATGAACPPGAVKITEQGFLEPLRSRVSSFFGIGDDSWWWTPASEEELQEHRAHRLPWRGGPTHAEHADAKRQGVQLPYKLDRKIDQHDDQVDAWDTGPARPPPRDYEV